ncbi:MAG: zf-HC2 domain-containing protein [Acidobacteriota bacterium]|jgi:hypothetical protein
MTTCDRQAERLTLHASGDLPPSQAREVEAHLAGCAACREELEALRRTLGRLRPREFYPREAEVDWDRLAAATVARVAREGNVVPFRPPAWRRPAVLARAAAVILAVGIGAVVLRAPAPERPEADGSVMSEGFQQRLEVNLARADTRKYLEQSRLVLLNVLESPVRCSKDEQDISAAREKSIQLLRTKLRLRDELSRPELARAAELCNQVEGILTEISTLQDCADLERIQTLREAVRRNQLLLKMGVLQGELGGSRA